MAYEISVLTPLKGDPGNIRFGEKVVLSTVLKILHRYYYILIDCKNLEEYLPVRRLTRFEKNGCKAFLPET